MPSSKQNDLSDNLLKWFPTFISILHPTMSHNAQAEPIETQFYLEGEIAIGRRTPYSIKGLDFDLHSDPWIIGEISIGAHAKVRGQIIDGQRQATTVLVTKAKMYN